MNSEAQIVNPDVVRVVEDELYDWVAQKLIDGLWRGPEKKNGIEWLKALGAKDFLGTVEPDQQRNG